MLRVCAGEMVTAAAQNIDTTQTVFQNLNLLIFLLASLVARKRDNLQACSFVTRNEMNYQPNFYGKNEVPRGLHEIPLGTTLEVHDKTVNVTTHRLGLSVSCVTVGCDTYQSTTTRRVWCQRREAKVR